jgi:hypothetical protein
VDALEDEANSFALDLMERLARVLPVGDLGFTSTAVKQADGGARMSVASAARGGIELQINEIPRLQIAVDYDLVMSPTSRRATVLRSAFRVRPWQVARPLFTVDYIRDAGSNIPAAHYNVHFDHDAVTEELLRAGAVRRGKVHMKRAIGGVEPRLADLHFPVGGHRFRPCLEDVIDMLWAELGIDMRPTARAAIEEGRRRWREMQLRAAVSDHPAAAIDELRQMGYQVAWNRSGIPEPTIRHDRVQAI